MLDSETQLLYFHLMNFFDVVGFNLTLNFEISCLKQTYLDLYIFLKLASQHWSKQALGNGVPFKTEVFI